MIQFSGFCVACQTVHQLPCTSEAIELARSFLPDLSPLIQEKGRMLGVLIGEDSQGRTVHLRAFSGTTEYPELEKSWAPTTRPTEVTQEAEATTFLRLNTLTKAIEEFPVASLEAKWREAVEILNIESKRLQDERTKKRQKRAHLRKCVSLTAAERERLDAESFDESRLFRETRKPLRVAAEQARKRLDEVIAERLVLKQERRKLSLQLQSQFNQSHILQNFRGVSAPIEEVVLPGMPIRQGVGECAAPKLLADAARRGIRPVALAEVWCGPKQTDPPREQGVAYGPCEERCAGILGFQLCGAERPIPVPSDRLEVLADSPQWAVCNKPGGLLSVPGRGKEKADSMLNRTRWHHPFGAQAEAAHRLDMETSGAFLVAFTRAANSHLQQQFARRTTGKIYLAFVPGAIQKPFGEIDLPLKQISRSVRGHRVDPSGKRAVTRYLVLDSGDGGTLLALYPLTGRTHQLRVHCKESQDIGIPILGDPLYGDGKQGETLFLHAWFIAFDCPITGSRVEQYAPVPESWRERVDIERLQNPEKREHWSRTLLGDRD